MTGPRKRRKVMPSAQRSKSTDNTMGLGARKKSNTSAGSESTTKSTPPVMGENTDSVSELKLLQEEITIQKQDKAIENTKLGLRCHICLETLRLPQLLVPCGHVACYECLKAWFLNSPNSTASDGDPESSEVEDNTTPARNRRGNNNNNGVAPRPPTNVVHVKKFCHHCRSSVKDRPVPVYALRDLVAIVDPEDESVKKAPPDDLWENIFPLTSLGTPPFQAIQPSPAPDREEREQTAEREVREHIRNQPIRQSSPIRHRILNPLPEAFYDNEDHVTRCGICLHEIWGFHCSNERCGAVYNEELMPINGSDHEDGDGSDIWEGFNGSPTFDAQYESSFIDDDEEDYNNSHAIFDVDSDPCPEEDTPFLHEISSEEESLSVSALNRPAGSRARSRRPIVIEDSDDEDDEDERPHLIDVSDESESEGESESDVYDYSLRLPVRTRPPRHRILSDEEDEPEIVRLNDDWNRSERSIEDKSSDESEEDVVISEENNTEEESMSASPQSSRKRLRRQIVSDEEEEDEEESEEDVDGDDGLDGENEETDEESSEPIRQRTIYPTRFQRGSTLLRRRFG